MFDIFKSLPGVASGGEVQELTKDEVAAQEKAERIQFHRERVRNGPVNLKALTSGQLRRLQARIEAREAKKARRAQVRQQLEQARFAATLRGQLAVAGVFPIPVEQPLNRQVDATVWIVRRFGVAVERADGPTYASFRREDVLTALRGAVEFYNKTTGAFYPKPDDDFEPAIYEVEDAA